MTPFEEEISNIENGHLLSAGLWVIQDCGYTKIVGPMSKDVIISHVLATRTGIVPIKGTELKAQVIDISTTTGTTGTVIRVI